jgi:hypothetical protein
MDEVRGMVGLVRKSFLLVLGSSLALGCQSSRKTPYADNPLLMSREPLLQSFTKNSPVVPTADPKPNTLPNPQPTVKPWGNSVKQTSNVTAAPIPDGPQLGATGETLTIKPPPAATPAIVVPPPESTKNVVPAEPVFTPSKAPAVLPTPPIPPQPVNTGIMPMSYQRFGHAPDYSWLQGEFDIHYRGFKELRFRSASEEDAFGGKVRLVDDARLNEFKPGDVVRVDGELVRDETNGGQYPRYHVKSIQLVERKTAK